MSRSPAVPAQRTDAAPPSKQVKPVDDKIGDALLKIQDRIMAAAPAHLDTPRLIEVVRTLVYRTPKLQQCIPGTIFASVMRAATLGFDLEPAMNEAFLIPRWNDKIETTKIDPDGNEIKSKGAMECQFQIGYQGLRKIAMQSDKIKTIETRLVRANDYFEVRYDPELKLDHRPVFGEDGGEITHVYGYAKLANGEYVIEVMTTSDIEKIHRRSESYKNAIRYKKEETGPWVSDWSEMARKTVLKRLCKSLPRSLELAKVIDEDNLQYSAEDTTPAPRLSQADQLKQRLRPPAKHLDAPVATEHAPQSEPDPEEPGEPEDIDITSQDQAPEPVQEAPKPTSKAPEPEPSPDAGPADFPVWGQPDTAVDSRPYAEVVKGVVASANAELAETAIGTEMEKQPPKITEAVVHGGVFEAAIQANLTAKPKKQLMVSDIKVILSPLYGRNREVFRQAIMSTIERQCFEIKKALGKADDQLSAEDIDELAEISEEATEGDAKE